MGLPPDLRRLVETPDGRGESGHDLGLSRQDWVWPVPVHQLEYVAPFHVGEALPLLCCLAGLRTWSGQVGEVDVAVRMMMVSEFEVVGDLVRSVAVAFCLELDHPHVVVPQHGVVRSATPLLRSSSRQVVLVDELEVVAGPTGAERQLVQVVKERCALRTARERVFHLGYGAPRISVVSSRWLNSSRLSFSRARSSAGVSNCMVLLPPSPALATPPTQRRRPSGPVVSLEVLAVVAETTFGEAAAPADEQRHVVVDDASSDLHLAALRRFEQLGVGHAVDDGDHPVAAAAGRFEGAHGHAASACETVRSMTRSTDSASERARLNS